MTSSESCSGTSSSCCSSPLVGGSAADLTNSSPANGVGATANVDRLVVLQPRVTGVGGGTSRPAKRYSTPTLNKRRSSLFSLGEDSVDISERQDDTVVIPERESHTADLDAFDRYVSKVSRVKRAELDGPFHAPFWKFLRDKLEEHGRPVGYGPHPSGPGAPAVPKGPRDNDAIIAKKFALDPFCPINPTVLAEMAGIDLSVVLTELTYATTVGMASVKFSPECVRCGGAVCEVDSLRDLTAAATDASAPASLGVSRRGSAASNGTECSSSTSSGRSRRARPTMNCAGCTASNIINSLDRIMVVYFLHPEVLYVLADGFGCKPSQQSIDNCAMPIAVVPGTSTCSGFRYSVGCGGELSMGDPLPKGRYRMHCPIARTDNYLEVLEDYEEAVSIHRHHHRQKCEECKAQDRSNPEEPGQENDNENEEDCHTVTLPLKVSEMQLDPTSGEKRTITVPHGAIHFDITPDTKSMFALWVQHDTPDEDVVFALPQSERVPFTSAADAMSHPTFDRVSSDCARLLGGTRQGLEMRDAVLVFTDVVGSTDMYAELGDGPALELVDRHFEVLFRAFGQYGRVVKTIGDAVMASFPTGKAAITAVAAALANVGEACRLPPPEEDAGEEGTGGQGQEEERRLQIRVGLHKGPAIIVPLNGINDYFGQTVNVAARVEGKAHASSCLITEAVLSDPSAMEAYEQVLAESKADDGTTEEFVFVAMPEVELELKGVKGGVRARGFKLVSS